MILSFCKKEVYAKEITTLPESIAHASLAKI